MKTKQLIPSLNGLRAVSILMVIFFHFRSDNYFVFHSEWANQLGSVFINGELGVNIFFIISGYLITTLLIKEKNKTGSISLKDFYLRRTLRIFPAYYALLLVYFVLQCFHYFKLTTTDWLSVILYSKQFFSSPVHEIGHLWSLSVEEVFYLVYPFLFIRFYKHIKLVVLLLIPVFVIARFHYYEFPLPLLKNTIFTSGDSLLIGCLFAFENDKIKRFITQHKFMSVMAFPLVLFSIVANLYIFSVFFHSSNIRITRFSFLPNLTYSLLGNVGLITNLLVAYLILFSINVRNWWFRFLNTIVMNYIGLLSYSI
ncbi:MAG: acyltransferase, partial [Bacteroidota bacterium]|nr:acyltransferase [Bacteroidota bacterium]